MDLQYCLFPERDLTRSRRRWSSGRECQGQSNDREITVGFEIREKATECRCRGSFKRTGDEKEEEGVGTSIDSSGEVGVLRVREVNFGAPKDCRYILVGFGTKG